MARRRRLLAQRPARLSQDRSQVPCLRWRADRSGVPQGPSASTRGFLAVRHLRLDGHLRPVHSPVHLCDGDPVLEAANASYSSTRSTKSLATSDPGSTSTMPSGRIATEAEAVWLDGHSDYGNSFARFQERYGSEITPRTTVIVTGDARNNYRPGRPEILDRDQVSRPERCTGSTPSRGPTGTAATRSWASTRAFCDGIYEVRTLRQLEHFVEQLSLPGHLTGARQGTTQLSARIGR